jgi:hypothetical protein
MKHVFKKTLLTILATLTVLTLAFSLVACGGTDDGSGIITVVIESAPYGSESIETKSYEVDLDEVTGAGLVGVFEHLRDTENVAFVMDGTMVSKIGNLENDYTNSVYIYLYTSVAADQDVSSYATTKEYNGMTLVSSGVGLSDMSAPDGAVIYVGTIFYG